MRKICATAGLFVSAFALVACGDTVNIGENGVAQGITVQATGTADVVPDAVRLSLTVSALAPTGDEALAQASVTAEKVRNTLQEFDIDSADIASQTLSVNPEYSYTEAEGQKLVGYRASQTFDVLIRQADDAGAVVEAVVAAGGANVSINATYPVVDDATLGTVAARKNAVDKARAKAQEYAELLGAELGEVVYLTEVSAPTNFSVGARADAMTEDASTVIDLGTQEVTVTIEIRYHIN